MRPEDITDRDRDRFMRLVLPFIDGCLLWQGAFSGGRDGFTYPVFSVRSIKVYAHRFSLVAFRGLIIKPHDHVHHHCRDSQCVAWDHLGLLHKQDHARHHCAEFERSAVGRFINSRLKP